MSYYYKQDFVSPSPLYAEIKEDLRSYFESGALDDMMFPLWTSQCLRRFKKSSYRIEQTVLTLDGYEACLPEDFNAVRELWACSVEYSQPIQEPNAFYYQRDCRIDDYRESGCSPCFGEDDDCTTNCSDSCDNRYMVTHKVTNHMIFSFTRTYLLTPGNINAKKYCGEACPNMYANTPYSYDIYNNKIITNFSEGSLHLIYYADSTNEEGEQLVPDNFYVQEYIKSYIKYKCFMQLSNQVTDETFNQIQLKKNEADQDQLEKLILAETDLKKRTAEDKYRDIGKSYRRFKKYNIR